jgi:hypothetical protein
MFKIVFFYFFLFSLVSCKSNFSYCEIVNTIFRNPQLYKQYPGQFIDTDSIYIYYDDSVKIYFSNCSNGIIKTLKTIDGMDTTGFHHFNMDPNNYVVENKMIVYRFLKNRYDRQYELIPFSNRRSETAYMHIWRFYKLGLNKYYMVYRFRYSNVEGLVEIKKKKGKVVITKQYHRQ